MPAGFEKIPLTAEEAARILADHRRMQELVFPQLNADMLECPCMLLNPSEKNTRRIEDLKYDSAAELILWMLTHLEDKHLILGSPACWREMLLRSDSEIDDGVAELCDLGMITVYETAMGPAFYPDPGVMFFPNKADALSGKYMLLPEEAKSSGISGDYVRLGAEDLIVT